MSADWIGYIFFGFGILAACAFGFGHVAAEWNAIKRWFRLRYFAVTHATELIATAHAYQALLPVHEALTKRLRAERDAVRRESERLARENARLRDRSEITVLQLPNLTSEKHRA